MGRIVHDDRGAASLEWRDAPDDYERPVLQIEGTGVTKPLSIKDEDTFNPYDRASDATLGGTPRGNGGKRDLKKLSAWIKLMREMEERKKKDDADE